MFWDGTTPPDREEVLVLEAARYSRNKNEGRGFSGFADGHERPDFYARLFGSFEVFGRGGRLDLGKNGRAIAILKRLLAEKLHAASQDLLMDQLWSYSSPRKARWSLNSSVYALRRLMDSWPGVPAGCIVLERGYYRLSPDLRILSDVEEFDGRRERGRWFERSGKTEEAIREYEEASGLYRGDYLAEDLYDDWAMIERERLAGAYVDVMESLANHYADAGELRKSIEACYRLLAEEPCHEGSYRLLMRCYARRGLRKQALHQYGLCEQALRAAYEASPEQETRELYERLRSGEAPG